MSDDDGYLWYNESNQVLYVSDWDDQQDQNGNAEWIPVNNQDVFVGEFPPTQNLRPGQEWFNTTEKRLYIYVTDSSKYYS